MADLIISRSRKNEAWYKKEADAVRALGEDMIFPMNDNSVTFYDKARKNYNIYKGKLNEEDYLSTLKPFGADVNIKILEEIENEDISSGKIKAVLGMEMKRPFPFKVIAVNSEATSRKEEEYFNRMKTSVISSIMQPIREQVELKAKEEMEGRELSPEEAQEITAKIQQEVEAQTPMKVKRYMERDHQDIAEVAGNHILAYLRKKDKLQNKFNKAFLYGLLTGIESGYIGEAEGHPCFVPIKPERIRFAPVESGFIEDSERIVCKYYWSPSKILTEFGNELTKKEIENIYEFNVLTHSSELNLDFSKLADEDSSYGICVEHCLWKGVRKLVVVTNIDEDGTPDISIEDESYAIDQEAGDVEAENLYIPETYEAWIINLSEPIYKRMRPFEGQSFDPEDVYNDKMPYKGVLYDAVGGDSVALMDRLSGPQVFYNIVKTKLKRLINSDKGKKLLLNIGMVPTSKGINTEKFMNYFENSPFALINPNEEGNGYNDINTAAKVIDMSLISDIQKYIMLLQNIKREAGASVGITEQVEGQISANEAVSNTKQSLMQSSQILEPYFNLHNEFKRQVLQGLLERAKITYRENTENKLSYITDDMGIQMFSFDGEFLSFQKLGVFITDNAKVDEVRATLSSLALAAMQNQKAELSDVIAVFEVESLPEAKEILKVAEKERLKVEEDRQAQIQKGRMEELEKIEQGKDKEHQRSKDLITHSEEEKRKTEIVRGAMVSASFNPDADGDKDGVNDYVEIAAKIAKIDLEQQKVGIAKEKLALEKKKVNNDIKNSNKSDKN